MKLQEQVWLKVANPLDHFYENKPDVFMNGFWTWTGNNKSGKKNWLNRDDRPFNLMQMLPIPPDEKKEE